MQTQRCPQLSFLPVLWWRLVTSDGREQLDLVKRQDQAGKICMCGEEEGGGQNFHFHQNHLHSMVGAGEGCGLQSERLWVHTNLHLCSEASWNSISSVVILQTVQRVCR